MRRYAFIVVALFMTAPFGATASDLVVWWDQGYNPEEDAAVREVIAAFEQESGKQVELVLSYSLDELPGKLEAAQGGPAARLRLRLDAYRLRAEVGPRG
jgi:ABC-type glycerol-3-phosphate transport system substrate-binding protein